MKKSKLYCIKLTSLFVITILFFSNNLLCQNFGIVGGVSLNDIRFTEENEISPLIGYAFGFHLEDEGVNGSFLFETKYILKGSNIDLTPNSDYVIKAHHLDFQFFTNYNFRNDISTRKHFFAGIGFHFGPRFAHSEKLKISNQEDLEINSDNFISSLDFDLGVNLIIGYRINDALINLRTNHGLINLGLTSDSTLKLYNQQLISLNINLTLKRDRQQEF